MRQLLCPRERFPMHRKRHLHFLQSRQRPSRRLNVYLQLKRLSLHRQRLRQRIPLHRKGLWRRHSSRSKHLLFSASRKRRLPLMSRHRLSSRQHLPLRQRHRHPTTALRREPLRRSRCHALGKVPLRQKHGHKRLPLAPALLPRLPQTVHLQVSRLPLAPALLPRLPQTPHLQVSTRRMAERGEDWVGAPHAKRWWIGT